MTGEEFLAWVDANREFIGVKTEVAILSTQDNEYTYGATEIYTDSDGDVVVK